MASRIVVGVDSSPPSRAALEWSAGRARDADGSLTIVHAVGAGRPGHPDVADTASADLLKREQAHAEELGATASVRLLDAEPFEALVESSLTAELVVLGTHKTGFIQGHVIGSRFVGLAAAAHSPVAFIPSIPLLSRSGVVVLLDDSPTGRRALGLAARQADLLGEELTLLYAGAARSAAHPALEAAMERVRADTPGIAVKAQLSRRGFARDLISATLLASLVVIAHPDARGSLGSMSGNLVHDVILNLGGPTMVVPAVDADA
jgi:nucleotide-binding universal stress UspA family protein